MFLALAREDATRLRALEALPPIPEDCQWANFVRNHDELTLDKLSEEERQEVFAALGPEKELQLYGRGLRRRLPTMVGGDERRIRMVYSLAFSLPGTPVLFYGEEIGMGENLAIDGRYSVRAPMQWSGDRRRASPPPLSARRPVVAEGPFGFHEVNVPPAPGRSPAQLDGAADSPSPRMPGARLGRVGAVDPGDAAMFAQRSDWEGSTVVAVHNLSGQDPRAAGARRRRAPSSISSTNGSTSCRGGGHARAASVRRPWFRLRRPGSGCRRSPAVAGRQS